MERDLLLGGMASWAGIKFSSVAYSHLGEWINHHSNDTGNEMHSIGLPHHSADTTLVAHDINGTMLVTASDFFYVRTPHLDIFQMSKSEDGEDVILNKRESVMYQQAISHQNSDAANRIKRQSDIWLLHMLLSDLRTLVTHCNARISKGIAEPFMFVISNITREKMPKRGKTGLSRAWEMGFGLFINNNTTSVSHRKCASELLDHLHKNDAPRLLAAQLIEASLHDHVFLSCGGHRQVLGCIFKGDGDVWETVRIVTVEEPAAYSHHSKRVGRIMYSIIES